MLLRLYKKSPFIFLSLLLGPFFLVPTATQAATIYCLKQDTKQTKYLCAASTKPTCEYGDNFKTKKECDAVATSLTAPSSDGSAAPKAAKTPSAPAALEVCDKLCEYNKKTHPVPTGYVENGGIIPGCAFSGSCRDANDLLQLVINVGKWSFGIIGLVAFVAFIYGGFMMIFSFGNAENVKKGRDALVAAVIGIAIAFSAYLVINFILDALSVKPEFRGIKSQNE